MASVTTATKLFLRSYFRLPNSSCACFNSATISLGDGTVLPRPFKISSVVPLAEDIFHNLHSSSQETSLAAANHLRLIASRNLLSVFSNCSMLEMRLLSLFEISS